MDNRVPTLHDAERGLAVSIAPEIESPGKASYQGWLGARFLAVCGDGPKWLKLVRTWTP
jgi:hypothetical protein